MVYIRAMEREPSHNKTVARLKGAGLRPTRQRIALADLLFAKGDRHISAEQLHCEAVGADVRVSLATVYNSLHQFTAAGLLREVVVESGRSYFDTNVSDHHHFFFENDGRLEDIARRDLRLADMPEPPEGYSIDRIDIVVRLKRTDS